MDTTHKPETKNILAILCNTYKVKLYSLQVITDTEERTQVRQLSTVRHAKANYTDNEGFFKRGGVFANHTYGAPPKKKNEKEASEQKEFVKLCVEKSAKILDKYGFAQIMLILPRHNASLFDPLIRMIQKVHPSQIFIDYGNLVHISKSELLDRWKNIRTPDHKLIHSAY